MATFYKSRLNKKEDEEITKKTVFLGLITLFVFLGLVTFGLPMLIKFSILLGETKNRKDDEIKEKVLPPLAPRIVIPFEATNSSRINVKGFSEKGTTVELLKNDESIGKTNVEDSGEFSFGDIMLNNGENVFTAIAFSDGRGSSEPSKSVSIQYSDKPPSLTMLNPSEDKLTVDYADFDVVGKSDKGVSVTINGRVAMVDDEGRFKLRFQLNSGNNQLEVVVKDLAGNETRKKIEIKFDI